MEPKANNRENYMDFLWVNFTELIGEGYSEKPMEFDKLFTVTNSDGAYEKYKEVNGLPIWEENFEGQAYNESQRSVGNEITIYNKRYDNSYSITWEYLEDNKERIMGGKGVDLDGARQLGRGCRVLQEITSAEIINKGFENVGYDGKPLFAVDHPTRDGIQANTPATAELNVLNDANLKLAIESIKGQTDNDGIKIQVKPNELFVSSDLYFTALTIINSALVSGTELNDKNVIGLVAPLTVREMSYFDKGIWVLKDTSIRNLIFQWRTKPEFGYYNVEGTADYKVYGRARWGVGYIDYKGLYGAKQTA